MLAPIVLFSDEFAKPSEYGIRRKKNCTLLQHSSAEPFGLGSHSHPLTIGQQNSFVLFFLLLHEYADLFTKAVNGFVEFFIDAICKISDECNQ